MPRESFDKMRPQEEEQELIENLTDEQLGKKISQEGDKAENGMDLAAGQSLMEAISGRESEVKLELIAEQNLIQAVENIEARDAGDPLFSTEWMKNYKEWLKGVKGKAEEGWDLMGKGWDEAMVDFKNWKEEHPKTTTAGRFTINTLRVGAVSCFKIMWGLFQFVYEAVKNKGNVKNAYDIGLNMFTAGGKDKGNKK